MAKSRGRDASISRGTLPLNTTRFVVQLHGVNPLGVSLPSPTIVPANLPRSSRLNRLLPDVTPLPTPPNRVAKNATGNNLYQPTPNTKKVTVCQSRAIRKEVLFAIGKGGRNGMKHARFTNNSKVKC